jgi:hypothetical protein
LSGRGAKSAHVDAGCGSVVTVEIPHLNADLLGQQIRQGARRTALDLLGGNHAHVDRLLTVDFRKARGRDYNSVVCCLNIQNCK